MPESRPNLVLFMPDQLRADGVGAFGHPTVQTPTIDALATRGTRFTNAFSQHSVCSPSRVSMFTGWYPHVAGHRTLDHLIQPGEPNVFASLRSAGYHVAMAGARGDLFAAGGTEAASDRFGFTVRPDLRHLAEWHKGPFPPDHRLFAAHYGGRLEGERLDFDEAMVRTAIDWLAEGLPEPWCLLLALTYPHPPFAVEEPWYSRHDRAEVPLAPPPPPDDRVPRFVPALRDAYGLDRLDEDDWREVTATYLGMVSRVDDQLRRVLDAVDAAGAAERTATFFFTDHGEYLGDRGLIEKWPAGVDDVLVRNPLIVHAPGRPEGQVVDAMAELVDLPATLLELAEAEPGYRHQGRSLVGCIDGTTDDHRDAAFSEGGFGRHEADAVEPLADGHYEAKTRLQRDDVDLVGRVACIRTPEWTYVHRLTDIDELYDRTADPRELVNLSGDPAHAEVESGLRARLGDWLLDTSDVIPVARDPRMDATLLGTWLDRG